MSILTAILPGVRTARAPLAAGTLVLLSVWLAVAPIDTDASHGAMSDAVIHAIDTASPAYVTALVAASAYLVGSLVVALEIWVIELWLRNAWMLGLRDWLTDRVDHVVLPSDERARYEALTISRPEAIPSWTNPLRWRPKRLRDSGLRYRQEEYRLVRFRLLSDHPELFAELDRIESESELRATIAAPILAVGIVVAVRTPSLVGAIAITAGAFLLASLSLISSLRAAMQAEKIVVDLIKSEHVALPWLERLEHTAATSSRRVIPASA